MHRLPGLVVRLGFAVRVVHKKTGGCPALVSAFHTWRRSWRGVQRTYGNTKSLALHAADAAYPLAQTHTGSSRRTRAKMLCPVLPTVGKQSAPYSQSCLKQEEDDFDAERETARPLSQEQRKNTDLEKCKKFRTLTRSYCYLVLFESSTICGLQKLSNPQLL